MKTDLDTLLKSYNLDALLVVGPGDHNPAMMYMTGGGHFTGELLKKRGQPPLLFCRSMERDEAAKTGLATKLIDDYKPMELLKAAGGDLLKATVARYQNMFADCGITSGRVTVYGKVEVGSTFAILNSVQEAMPGLTFVGEVGNTMLMEAQLTKDEDEAARIRKMGQITTTVVGQVADFLTSHKTRDGMLVKPDGQPLTVGEVKSASTCGWPNKGQRIPRVPSSPSGAIQPFHTAPARPAMLCAWGRPSSSTSTRVSRAEATIMISRARGAWAMLPTRPGSFTRTCWQSTTRSPAS
jgi:hypothetical protein